MRPTKKILLIAYHYHPDLQVGAQRTIKYAKYLPQFGWEPHVLTVKSDYYPQQDTSPPESACPAYRTGMWPRPDDIYAGLKRVLRRTRSQPEGERARSGVAAGQSVEKPPTPVWKKSLNTLSLTPDNFSGWFFPATLTAWRLIRKHKYDVIYTSGPPQTCHMVGWAAHRLTGVRWVIDFRDPWLFPKERDRHVLRLSKKFDEYFEKQAARQAALVITTTDEWRDHLKSLYKPLLDHKCHTIVNGFDEDDFGSEDRTATEKAADMMKFLHAGNLYAGRDPSAMLEAAGELLTEGFVRPKDVLFAFYGNSDIDMSRINRSIAYHQMEQAVTFAPPVSRSGYLDLLRGADVLILVQGETGRVHIPAKAFEYLGTGKEILVLTSEGATKNFMSRFEHVHIADLNDKPAIKERLKTIITRGRSGGFGEAKSSGLKAVTKRQLTAQFAGLLDDIATGGSSGNSAV
ncbi:MAG: glycosyltransferase [Candidatus Zixiibacteriota bacterium]|nr:MAG: glycosyltransferase [candidate division Zixibacteria bacterium]